VVLKIEGGWWWERGGGGGGRSGEWNARGGVGFCCNRNRFAVLRMQADCERTRWCCAK
jgi:hypothetical protein